MTASVASGGSAMGTEPMRVLIADDEPLARQRLRALLARYVNGDLVVFPAAAWIVSARKS